MLTTRLGRNQAVRIEAFCLFNQVFHANANGVLQFGQDHLFPNPLTVTTHQAPKHRLYIIGYSDTIPKEITKNQTFHLLANMHCYDSYQLTFQTKHSESPKQLTSLVIEMRQ